MRLMARTFARMKSFNVAASIKMRKSEEAGGTGGTGGGLQCGRIYKDAEIRLCPPWLYAAIICFNVAASIKMRKYRVQCVVDALAK